MDRNSISSTDSQAGFDSSECIERIRSGISSAEFGYKMQALAAHVLLRCGYRITAVNRSGHPDIISILNGKEFRFEVEAQAGGPRHRKLTVADFDSLVGGPNLTGYYALAVSFPTPYWVLVPASKLVDRKLPSSNALLEALSDKEYSEEWTREYIWLLQNACRQIRLASFHQLSQMALEGHRL